MKRLTVSTLALTLLLGLTYQSYAAGWGTATATHVMINDLTSGCDHPVYNCEAWDEFHWAVKFPNNASSCHTLKFKGSNVSGGHWFASRYYQLTKSWMYCVTNCRCLDNVTCGICLETATCSPSDFKATCWIS